MFIILESINLTIDELIEKVTPKKVQDKNEKSEKIVKYLKKLKNCPKPKEVKKSKHHK